MAFWLLRKLLICTLAVLVSFSLYFRFSRSKNTSVLPTSWPVVGILPSIFANLHSIHDNLSVILARSAHNLRAHGPLGTGMRFFITCNPANVQYIFTRNFPNYQKGKEFTAIFHILDGATFAIDGDPWRQQRREIQSILTSQRMVSRMVACCRGKLENVLLPLLSHMEGTDTPFDMQEMMGRLLFDLTTMVVIGLDPGILSSDKPPMDVSAAMDMVMEVGFLRHVMPISWWKTMRLLNIGPERKVAKAHTVLRGFFWEMMERRKMIEAGGVGDAEERDNVFMLSSYIADPDFADDRDVVCAIFLGLMLGGKDTIATTLSWFFYNLTQNLDAVLTIRNELSPIASRKIAGGRAGAMLIFEPEQTKSLVYLRAALYETLRLYPPGPMERKTVSVDDIMPTGHEVCAGDTIFISLYSMGRMEGIWGKDCLDYDLVRWLSKDGDMLTYVPSHKFLAFNSGPRICPGKEVAVMQMKTIVAAVVWNFDMELVEGQTIEPKTSCVLQMKNGLIMKLKKREM